MALIFAITDAIDEEDTDQEDRDDTPKAAKLRTMIIDTCQDLVFSVTGWKNIPPKQYSLGLTSLNYSQ